MGPVYVGLCLLAVHGPVVGRGMNLNEIKKMLESGDIDAARFHLIDIVKADRNQPRAWLLLSGIAMRTDDWNLGVQAFRALVELRPNDSLSSSGLVQSLFKLERYTEVMDEINRFDAVADRENAADCAVLLEHNEIVKEIRARELGGAID